MSPVVVDTCVWVPYLNKRQRTKHPLSKLLEHDKVVLLGPILQEILIGIKRKEQARWVASQLEGTIWENTIREDWIEAANLGRELRKKEILLPAADLQIAATTLRKGFQLWTTDPHFDSIPEIARYHPDP